LEVTSFTLVLVLGAMGLTFPPNLALQFAAALALLLPFLAGPLCIAFWVAGRRSHEPPRIRDEAAGVLAVILLFVSAAAVAVVLLAPIST